MSDTPLTAESMALLDWLVTERTFTSPYGPPVSLRFDRLALADRLAAIERAARVEWTRCEWHCPPDCEGRG